MTEFCIHCGSRLIDIDGGKCRACGNEGKPAAPRAGLAESPARLRGTMHSGSGFHVSRRTTAPVRTAERSAPPSPPRPPPLYRPPGAPKATDTTLGIDFGAQEVAPHEADTSHETINDDLIEASPSDGREESLLSWKAPEYRLIRWRDQARESQNAHYMASIRAMRLHWLVGGSSIIVSTMVGTAVFSSLQDVDGSALRLTFGCLSVCAAVLTALSTFLRLSERAERHRTASVRYGAVARHVELEIALRPHERGSPKDVMARVQEQLQEATIAAPALPLAVVRAVSTVDPHTIENSWTGTKPESTLHQKAPFNRMGMSDGSRATVEYVLSDEEREELRRRLARKLSNGSAPLNPNDFDPPD